MKWFLIAIEWFLNLFIPKKAKKTKQEAFLERQNEILEYKKTVDWVKKKQAKYNGKIRRSPRL